MFQFEVDADEEPAVSPSQDSTSLSQDFAINDQVVVDKNTGIVRYIGVVEKHQGIWIGIEWDDPKRGKHDGTVDGVQYFQCINNSLASFVRPPKVQKTKNVIEAFHLRYGHNEHLSKALKPIPGVETDRSKVAFNELTMVDLSGMNIASIEGAAELTRLCPNVQYLNVAVNLLQDWNDIVRLSRCFHLKRLDLSANLLNSTKMTINAAEFAILEHLILGNLNYDWKEILDVPFLLPQLLNLQLQFNNITTLSPTIPELVNLRQLDLSGNHISKWDEVLKLSDLRSLEYLNLSANLLEEIVFPGGAGQSSDVSYFSKLTRLNLSTNCISDWASVDQLNRLVQLHELRLDLNPFLEKGSKADNRLLIIAKIGQLKKLEGAEINVNERRDAQIEFVSKPAQLKAQDIPADSGPDSLHKTTSKDDTQHNAPVENKATTKTFFCLQITPADTSLPRMQKEFLPTTTVSQLRKQINILYSRKWLDKVKVEVVSCRNPKVRFQLETDYKTLDQYSVEDSDTLSVTWSTQSTST